MGKSSETEQEDTATNTKQDRGTILSGPMPNKIVDTPQGLSLDWSEVQIDITDKSQPLLEKERQNMPIVQLAVISE